MFSPQFTLKVSHPGKLYLELCLDEESRGVTTKIGKMRLLVYDFTASSSKRELASMTMPCDPNGPLVCHHDFDVATLGETGKWSSQRTLHLDLSSSSNSSIQHPVQNREYVVACVRWETSAEPVKFTVTAYYRPILEVALDKSTLQFNYAKSFV